MADLIKVYDPIKDAGKPRIIFIHGLDGDLQKTWMTDPNNIDTLWPKWIGIDTGCPVWLLGYSATSTRWKADSMPLQRAATAVIERLSNEPKFLSGPLILIGHSLGGLVIKTALQHGMSRETNRHREVAMNIKGIAFIGTPHFGSKLATIASWFRLSRANPSLSDLRLDNAQLETLNQYFLKLRNELAFETRVYMETQPVRLPWWLGGRFFPGLTIVSPSSSEVHVPNEVATPVDADHISICKPKNRTAAIYASILQFTKDVEFKNAASTSNTSNNYKTSESFEAIKEEQKEDEKVHLSFSMSDQLLSENDDNSIITSLCIATDSPDRLCKSLQDIRTKIQKDPLINQKTKTLSGNSTLTQLIENLETRAKVLREVATISFSAYLYYCPKSSYERCSADEKAFKLIIEPLIHRLSKKGQSIEYVHTSINHLSSHVQQAVGEIQRKFHRTVNKPELGANKKYSALVELTNIIAKISALHLAQPDNAEVSNMFESFRTRIRYAENVSTGEKHTRDRNPLH